MDSIPTTGPCADDPCLFMLYSGSIDPKTDRITMRHFPAPDSPQLVATLENCRVVLCRRDIKHRESSPEGRAILLEVCEIKQDLFSLLCPATHPVSLNLFF